MEYKQLIFKLQELKQIKPRKEWVFSVKNQILGNDNFEIISVSNKLSHKGILPDIIKNFLLGRKLAYAFAALLFVFIVGTFGLASYNLININDAEKVAKESPAALVAIKDNVETFKVKSKSLADIAKYNVENIPLAIKEVKDVAIELTGAIQKDPQLAKAIALEVNNNKTYLNISGGESDLQVTLDFLYKTTAEQLLKDFDGVTLIENQQESLDRIKDFFNKGGYEGKYANALEDILLFNAAVGRQ